MSGHQWRHDVSSDGTEVEVLCSVCGAWPTYHGTLVDYATGEDIRAATCDESVRSDQAMIIDDGRGLISVDGRIVWVRP